MMGQRSGLRLAGLAALAVLAACTASPLYGPTGIDPVSGRPQSALAELAGRIAVTEPGTRTDQVVRNALLFRLNGAAAPNEPLYEVELATDATDSSVSIQSGTGVPTASLYRLTANYTLRRLPGREVVATGTRFATAPYDRSEQLFAAQRAIIDAREKAGASLADQLAAALTPVLRREVTGRPVAGVVR